MNQETVDLKSNNVVCTVSIMHTVLYTCSSACTKHYITTLYIIETENEALLPDVDSISQYNHPPCNGYGSIAPGECS